MPGFDGTGPPGRGAGTGGGRGFCGLARRRAFAVANRPRREPWPALRRGAGLRRGRRTAGNGGATPQE